MYVFIIFYRLDKERIQKLNNVTNQREKFDDENKKELEKHTARKSDLDKQLLSMEEKFRVKICELHIFHLYFLLTIYMYSFLLI